MRLKSQIIMSVFISVIDEMENDYDDGTYEQTGTQNRLIYGFPQNIINKWPSYGRKEEIDIVTKIENPYYS